MNKPSQTHFISLKKFVNKTLNVDSLFTNIPLDKTIDISIDSLYKDNENTPKIPKNLFRNLLNVPTKESFLRLTTNSIHKLMVRLWGLH